MKLVKAHVTNFRSVEDSEPFTIDQVTCLVGKNEAGKSALLLALTALNPHPSTPVAFDKERDYPRRHLTSYETRHGGKDALVTETEWTLDDGDLKAIEAAVGEGVVAPTQKVTVRRSYNATATHWLFSVDQNRLIENLLITNGYDESQRSALKSASSPAELVKLLEAIPTPSDTQPSVIAWLKRQANFLSPVHTTLLPRLPTFMYFSNYDRMDGAVQFEALQQAKASGQLLQDEFGGARLFLGARPRFSAEGLDARPTI